MYEFGILCKFRQCIICSSIFREKLQDIYDKTECCHKGGSRNMKKEASASEEFTLDNIQLIFILVNQLLSLSINAIKYRTLFMIF